MLFVEQALYSALGAALQELLYWYNLRAQLEARKYQKLLTSPAYWIITAGMIVASGLVAPVWYSGSGVSPRDLLIFGVGLPLIIKQAVNGVQNRQGIKLGPSDDASTYFKMK